LRTDIIHISYMNKANPYSPYENWSDQHTYAKNVEEIDIDSDRALLYREGKSHRGISSRSNLRRLKAAQVNQDFLEEICSLEKLEYLELEVITAQDLAPLKNLVNIKTLILERSTKADNFSHLVSMSWLNSLVIQQAKYLSNLEFLSSAHHLQYLGIEGSIWTKQKIQSLEPLAGLKSLEQLSLTSVVLVDKDLTYLADIPKLKVLQCARFAPKSRFMELRKAAPKLKCRWCDSYEIE